MSSRVFQSVIVQMKEAVGRGVGIVDSEGTVVASGELSLIGTKLEEIVFGDSKDQIIISGRKTFKLLSGFQDQLNYAVFVEGEDTMARAICNMAAIAFNEAKAYYEERYDKATFIKNIISDNILPGDIYVRTKEFHFPIDVPRAVFLIRQLEKTDVVAIELMQSLFPDRERDFILSVSDTEIVLVREVSMNTGGQELLKVAESIQETISSELSIKTVIGVGTTSHHLRELAEKYKEARAAIDVGLVFDSEKTILNYENLGIGRLIYQLPVTLCEMFLSEIFKKNPIESLDQETLYTINKFFENNLNVSETSRKLFVHRNTLVYRLEKIKKLTGLDLREFDHAIVFKVALMVKKYLNAQDN